MKRALIQPEKCQRCSPCLVEEKCPKHAAFLEKETDQPWVDFYQCAGCMKCKGWCKYNAIEEITHPCDGKGRMGW
jgi:MinD superfamily P-loop ATPase